MTAPLVIGVSVMPWTRSKKLHAYVLIDKKDCKRCLHCMTNRPCSKMVHAEIARPMCRDWMPIEEPLNHFLREFYDIYGDAPHAIGDVTCKMCLRRMKVFGVEVAQ